MAAGWTSYSSITSGLSHALCTVIVIFGRHLPLIFAASVSAANSIVSRWIRRSSASRLT